MGKSKQLFTELREQEIQDEFLDDDYQYREFQSRERVSSKTQIANNSSIEILTELFGHFGEIFKHVEVITKEHEVKNQMK
jgi:hypothetical protein